MILLDRTNGDWWHVRKADATEGFVPANYVKEVEPKVAQKVVKRPVKVPERVKVKKTVMKKEVVRKKKERVPSLRRAPSGRKRVFTTVETFSSSLFFNLFHSVRAVVTRISD